MPRCLHSSESGVNGSAPRFDGHDGVETPYRGLERFEMPILVGEYSKFACIDSKTYTRVYILC